jgi:putative membrane protein
MLLPAGAARALRRTTARLPGAPPPPERPSLPIRPIRAAPRRAPPARAVERPAAATAAAAPPPPAPSAAAESAWWPEDEEVDLTDEEDDVMEEGQKQMRVVYDHARWATHRSGKRYWRHMAGLLHSTVVSHLARPVLSVTAVAAAVCSVRAAVEAGLLPAAWAGVRLGLEPFSLTSSALGLLLVFRTNTSYARWLTARSAWATVAARCADLARQALTWTPPGAGGSAAGLAELVCRWAITFTFALKAHLRDGEDAAERLAARGTLPPAELAAFADAPHRPLFAAQMLSEAARAVSMEAHRVGAVAPVTRGLDANITALGDALGACERLLQTPIPNAYTRHTTRFLVLWLGVLPLALWPVCRWASVPVAAITTWALLGIESLGVLIEEPFATLPLGRLSADVAENIEGMLATARGGGGHPTPAALVDAAVAAARTPAGAAA